MSISWYKHCSFCWSTNIAWIEWTAQYICDDCHKTTFLNIAVAAWCFLYDNEGNILLAQRARDPWKGKYDDPGGFMDYGDNNAEATVVRELKEELGIDIDPKRLEYLANHTMVYHYQWRDVPDCAFLFYAKISHEEKAQISASDDVAAVRWFNEDNFDESVIATPSHIAIIRKLFAKIKNINNINEE